MKTELTEQKNKFIRKVKNILLTLGPFIIILINLANIITITINTTITNVVSPRRW